MFDISKKVNYPLILSLILTLYLIPKYIFIDTGSGIDASWRLGLNLALRENLVWGTDIVFTFGPLGFLSTQYSVFVNDLFIILFYIFIAVNGFIFIYYVFRHAEQVTKKIMVFVVFVFFGHILFFSDTTTLYFYSIFHIFHYLKYKKLVSLSLLSSFAFLAFFIKINTGILLNILFVATLSFYFYQGQLSKIKYLTYLLVHFVLLYLFSIVLKVNIQDYIFYSLELINGYNDAMVYSVRNIQNLYNVIFLFFLIFILFIVCFKEIIRYKNDIYLSLNICAFLFVIFKQSFVRADSAHLDFIYLFLPLILILSYLFFISSRLKFLIFLAILPFSIICIISLTPGTNKKKFYSHVSKFKLTNNYFKSDSTFQPKLPARIIKEIGDNSVDILGYETSYIFYNDLKFNPRPVFQSYVAYTPELIKLNAQKYSKISAPDYVLYEYNRIDNRHPFWDEPKTYLQLSKYYSHIDTVIVPNKINNLMLFEKSAKAKSFESKKILDTIINLNSIIKIPESSHLIFMTLDIQNTKFGNLKRFLFQPSPVMIKLNYADGETSAHRLVVPIMKSGVPINKKILDYNDAFTYFKSFGKENILTTSFNIHGNDTYLDTKIRMKLFEYKLN